MFDHPRQSSLFGTFHVGTIGLCAVPFCAIPLCAIPFCALPFAAFPLIARPLPGVFGERVLAFEERIAEALATDPVESSSASEEASASRAILSAGEVPAPSTATKNASLQISIAQSSMAQSSTAQSTTVQSSTVQSSTVQSPPVQSPPVQIPTLQKAEAQTAEAQKPKAASTSTPSKYAWTKLTTEIYPGKQDDIYFVSPTTGWYVNGAGKIFKTTDGGSTWTEKLHKPGTYFRCITFVDEKLGFAGNIGPDYFPKVSDTNPLYRTEDGGETWTPVTNLGPEPVVGLCALEVTKKPFVNAGNLDQRVTIYAAGRVGGPAVFLSSNDLGATWKRVDLAGQCGMVLDVHFRDAQHGFIAAATSTDVEKSHALILATKDGGATWAEVYRSDRPYELTWKMSFPTDEVGYVTIQSYDPSPKRSTRFVAKTLDGGATWKELPFVDDAKVREFGIAFVDDKTGWIGAMPGGFQTEDGGATWAKTEMGNAVNKIRIVKSDTTTVGYAIGVEVRKLVIDRAQ